MRRNLDLVVLFEQSPWDGVIGGHRRPSWFQCCFLPIVAHRRGTLIPETSVRNGNNTVAAVIIEAVPK